MAKSKSIGGIYAELSLKDIKFRKGIKAAESSLNRFASDVAKIGTRTAAAGAVAAGAAIVAGITKSIKAAADMETIETAFIPLLGSADAAEKRMEELSQFAASTPFELPQIADASKILETLTRGALSTGKGLEMVGDIASATNRPFDEVAVSVGRLYDGLQSGRPVGEAMARLQELGVISGDTRAEIEQLQKEGRKGDEVWAIAREAMEKFSGSMEMQSQTWNGKISTLKDNINLAFAALGQPINEQLKVYLDDLASKDFTDMAESLGMAISDGLQLITDGKVWDVFTLHAQKAALEMERSLSGVFATINAGLSSPSDVFMAGLMNPEAMARIGSSANNFRDSGNAEINILEDQIAEQIEEIMKVTRSRSRSKKSAALIGKGIGPLFDQGIPDWLNNLPLVGPKSFDMFGGNYGREMERQSSPWESTRYDVNEMQARGLAMGGVYVDKEEKKQTTILTTIRDILKKAETSGELKWA